MLARLLGLTAISALVLVGCSPAEEAPTSATTSTPSPASQETSEEVDPLAVPADEAWEGEDSPVLSWRSDQRDEYLALYADDVNTAMGERGLTGEEDIFVLIGGLSDVLPRAAREVLLLQGMTFDAESADDVAVLESAVLQQAWTACQWMGEGETFSDVALTASLVNYVSENATDANVVDAYSAVALGTFYASLVCPEYTDVTLAWLADNRSGSSTEDTAAAPYVEAADLIVEHIAAADDLYHQGSQDVYYTLGLLSDDMTALFDLGAPSGLDSDEFDALVFALGTFYDLGQDEVLSGYYDTSAARYAVSRENTETLLSEINDSLGTAYSLPAWDYLDG